MEQNAILLNAGHDHDVDCLDGADPSLARLLGAAPSKPAVSFLRTMQDTEGKQSVGVFIGSQHVGYLPRPVDAGLLATIQACEMNGAVARARGNLTASWDCPGKVKVKISLADAEHLLHRPEPESATPVQSSAPAGSPEPAGQAPQPGWLVSSARSSPVATAEPEDDDRRRLDEEIIAAWTSSPPNLGPATA